MKFKSPQAQEAYQEVLTESGKAIADMISSGRKLADENSDAAISILLSTQAQAGAARIDAVCRAIQVASEIDQRWTSLAAHLVQEASLR